jgi:hypothetical protein
LNFFFAKNARGSPQNACDPFSLCKWKWALQSKSHNLNQRQRRERAKIIDVDGRGRGSENLRGRMKKQKKTGERA